MKLDARWALAVYPVLKAQNHENMKHTREKEKLKLGGECSGLWMEWGGVGVLRRRNL